MEILSPAGSFEHITAAVRSGANAVYLGTKNLNARRNAQNFSEEELRLAIEYCHARNVKVYIALNILVTDYEIELTKKEIAAAAKLGADALIIQDLAVLNLAKKTAPDMPLHASTQMSVHNLSGVRELERLGFSRFVPSRELSLSELEAIQKGTSLELEVFVHGSLCMSVSGQCYMSSVFGRRSANRGMCAQPCRLNFRNQNSDHALSLKDLCAIDTLCELEKLGITSAKIEGRMKRPEYTAAATRACKAALSGKKYDKNELQAVFSRSGFTNGYLEGNIGRNLFGYRTKEDVTAATPMLNKIAVTYRKETALIGVDMEIIINRGNNIKLKVTDGKNTVKVEGGTPQKAITYPITESAVTVSLNKCGGTPFYVKNIVCSIDDGLAVAISEINNLRKTALDKLLKAREQITPYKINDKCEDEALTNIPRHTSPLLIARFESKSQICPNADKIIVPYDTLFKNPDICSEYYGKIIAELPSLLFCEKNVDQKLSALMNRGIDTIYAPNIYALYYARRHGFKAMGGFGLNIMNSLALHEYAKIGLNMAEISFECSLNRFNKLKKPVSCGLALYGKMPLMTFRACPSKSKNGCNDCNGKPTITDRQGNKMTVLCQNKAYSKLINPKPIYMADKIDEIKDAGFITLHFTDEDRAQCIQIINDFKERKAPDIPFTRGLYYREIK